MAAAAFIGIDLGTSSVRCSAVDAHSNLIASHKTELPPPLHNEAGHYEQDPNIWWQATLDCLQGLLEQLPHHKVAAIAVDGTSGTLLLADHNNEPLGNALMYNDSRASQQAQDIAKIAPAGHMCASASSSLARLLYLLDSPGANDAVYALHQADWILAKLSGVPGISDENNCLKLGYDAAQRCWPGWLTQLDERIMALLPRVYASGCQVVNIDATVAAQLNMNNEVALVTGTTDSTASTLATGISRVGEAVTTIGTTLVTKILCEQPIFDNRYGIYSHRLNHNLWLAGGASNCGGKTLLQYFDVQQIEQLSSRIAPSTPTGLDYYPLPETGERFPINDVSLQPRLAPRPDSEEKFLQAIFEGLAQVEKLAYQRLQECGAPAPVRILTAGGAASTNAALLQIRQSLFDVPVSTATHTEASYGAALIAQRALAGSLEC
ncbi:MAG: FGGY-family carbohydrate kinase [Chromatiales bacterium]|jgi:sugar (pentulose or hexulose) kinase